MKIFPKSKKRERNDRYLRYLKFLIMPRPKKGDPPIDMQKVKLSDEDRQWLLDNVELPG
jgi:hypothetical protein